MALAITNLTSGRPNNVSSFNTNSVSPGSGTTVLISIGSRFGSGSGGNTPTISSGLGATWNQVIAQPSTGGSQGVKMTIYVAVIPSATSGVIAVSFGGQTQVDSSYSVEQIAGGNTGNGGLQAVIQKIGAVVTSSTSQSISLSALKTASDVAFGAFYNGASGVTPTVGSGFTALGSQGAFLTEYKINTTTVNYSYNGPNDSVGVAFELGLASSGFLYLFNI